MSASYGILFETKFIKINLQLVLTFKQHSKQNLATLMTIDNENT